MVRIAEALQLRMYSKGMRALEGIMYNYLMKCYSKQKYFKVVYAVFMKIESEKSNMLSNYKLTSDTFASAMIKFDIKDFLLESIITAYKHLMMFVIIEKAAKGLSYKS